jgi:hypothetical protein
MEMSGQLHDPVALTVVKILLYLLDRMLSGPQSWSGCSGKEKKIPALAEN